MNFIEPSTAPAAASSLPFLQKQYSEMTTARSFLLTTTTERMDSRQCPLCSAIHPKPLSAIEGSNGALSAEHRLFAVVTKRPCALDICIDRLQIAIAPNFPDFVGTYMHGDFHCGSFCFLVGSVVSEKFEVNAELFFHCTRIPWTHRSHSDHCVWRPFDWQQSVTLYFPEVSTVFLHRIVLSEDNRTTCMIRNIPNKYNQQMLLDLINESHYGLYDFFYLRIDFKNRCNVGYAFLNLISPKHLATLYARLAGKRWSRFNSEKVCAISYAKIQGRDRLVEKFRASTVMQEDPSYRPKIFYTSGLLTGLEQKFPSHDKRLIDLSPAHSSSAACSTSSTSSSSVSLLDDDDEERHLPKSLLSPERKVVSKPSPSKYAFPFVFLK